MTRARTRFVIIAALSTPLTGAVCQAESGSVEGDGPIDGGSRGDEREPLTPPPPFDAGDDGGPVTARASRLAAGGSHACVILRDGNIACWGAGLHGEIGDGRRLDTPTPVRVPGLSGIPTRLALGDLHSCVAFADASIMCWGDNGASQLATDDAGPRALVPVRSTATASAILVAGDTNVCTAGDAGVYCWGQNDLGQLGALFPDPSADPLVALPAPPAASALGVGSRYVCALKNGQPWCWGRESHHQLGRADASVGANPGPHAIDTSIANASALAAGARHACVASAGVVRCWGDGALGQLGTGADAAVTAATTIAGPSDVQALALGDSHSCALEQSGRVWCWGDNTFGQTGADPVLAIAAPHPIAQLAESITAIAAGRFFTCALGVSGRVWCWGANTAGQLGDGTKDAKHVPTLADLP